MRRLIAILPPLAATPAFACDAKHIGEPTIRVAALIFLAEKGVGAPAPLIDLVEAVKQRLITCEDKSERRLIEKRIRSMAYRDTTKTGLKTRGQADYDPVTNTWSITQRGVDEVAIWRRLIGEE